MRKISDWLRVLLLYLTALALLAGQGVNAHIHLADTHHHDGNHHHHAAEVHTDHFADHDVSLTEHATVIELDVDYRAPTFEQQKKPLAVLIYEPPRLHVAGTSTRIKPPPRADGWLEFSELSTRHPRAPPLS